MSGRRSIIVLCLALVLSIAAFPAHAGEDSGTVTLYWLEYHAIEMNPEIDPDIRGTWDIRVVDGSPVNIYYMSKLSFEAYEDPSLGEFSYNPEESRFNTTSVSRAAKLSNSHPTYLVIECAGHSATDSSTVEYDVEWDEEPMDWYDYCIPGSIVAGAAAVVVIYMWWRMRGGRSADGAPPDGMPPDVTPPPGSG